MIALESNPVDLLLGRTNEEVAAKSRSQHKSQGFGSSPKLGSQMEYLELINGNKPSNTNLCVLLPSSVPVKPTLYLVFSNFVINFVSDTDLNLSLIHI